MLHELLLALLGHDGQIFSRKSDTSHIKVSSSSQDLFHPSETSALNLLLEVGSEYSLVQNFVDSHNKATSQGLYMVALCHGLQLVLDEYRDCVLRLEQQLVKASNVQEMSLSHIRHSLSRFQPVLSALNKLIDDIEVRQIRGCLLLELVYKSAWTGVEDVRVAMLRVLRETHKLLYKQLLPWLSKGVLQDPFDEFFISAKKDSETNEEQFVLSADRIPSHISLKMAEKIFFVGQSVRLFDDDKMKSSQKEKTEAKRVESHRNRLSQNEIVFYKKLVLLRDAEEFDFTAFSSFVDEVSSMASLHLHELVLEHADLLCELRIVRDVFLLGRGELFHVLIENADGYLSKSIQQTSQHDLTQLFLASCRLVLAEEEEILTYKTSLKFLPPSSTASSYRPSSSSTAKKTIAWDCVRVYYNVPWPLHLIFTPKNLDEYNRIFVFLLRVRRVQYALERAWALGQTRINIGGNKNDAAKISSYLHHLRLHMSFVVQNLQQYFMADVLESQFALLTSKLKVAENFDELVSAHDKFISSVITLTFVGNSTVYHCLNELLSVCLGFSSVVLKVEDRNELTLSSLKTWGTSFSRQSSLLFKLLSSLKNQHAGSHLAQLLLRIDFNRFYSKRGHDIGQLLDFI